jgi:flagellar motor switch protein FliG
MARKKWGAEAYKNMQKIDGKPEGKRVRKALGLKKQNSDKPSSIPKMDPYLNGFLKSGKPAAKSSRYRKIAKFLIVLGVEDAAKVLSHFDGEEVESVIHELSLVKTVGKEEREKLFEEFGKGLKKTWSGKPLILGEKAAKTILAKAFGDERAEEIFNRAVPKSGYFDFLKDIEAAQTALLLKDESVLVQAVVLPYLDPEKSSKVLEGIKEENQLAVVKRIARMKTLDTSVIEKIADALREKAHRIGKTDSADIDGKGVLADILKYIDPEEGKEIIETLQSEAPEVAQDIEDRLFTMDSILSMNEKDLQKIIRQMEDKEIALLLKGKRDAIRAKILNNVSERRRLLITEEYKILGPMPKHEVDEAARDFIRLVRDLEEEGEIVLRNYNEEIID